MASPEAIREAETALFGAQERVAELRRQLKRETDPGRRRVLQLRIQDAAIEEEKATLATFAVLSM